MAAVVRVRDDVRPLGASLPLLLAATLLAAVLPTPTYRQYVLPVVPPLLLLIASRWDGVAAWISKRPWRRAIPILLAASMVAGCGRSLWFAVSHPLDRRPVAMTRQAHHLGQLGRLAGGGPVAGLDPLLIVDSGLGIDRRFATGPFLFRAGNLVACRDAALCPVTFQQTMSLDRAPPRLLLTGSERRSPRRIAGGMDGFLDRWAESRGYRAIQLPHDQRLWLAPRQRGR